MCEVLISIFKKVGHKREYILQFPPNSKIRCDCIKSKHLGKVSPMAVKQVKNESYTPPIGYHSNYIDWQLNCPLAADSRNESWRTRKALLERDAMPEELESLLRKYGLENGIKRREKSLQGRKAMRRGTCGAVMCVSCPGPSDHPACMLTLWRLKADCMREAGLV